MNERILIAMSGGVDSSAAALLLQKEGFSVEGMMLRLWTDSSLPLGETAGEQDAARVSAHLGIPFSVADYTAAFRSEVINAFIAAYEAGETPNPCVLCNRRVKFAAILREADARGIPTVATGHYARIRRGEDGRYQLLRGADAAKDQSYMLYDLTQEQLARVRFPLGDLTKAEIRAIAKACDLPVAAKKDSQDICFIPDGDYVKFITETNGNTYPAGEFRDRDGHVLGKHRGLIRYTTGQRKGLGLALPAPMYVLRKDIAENAVILGTNEDLFSSECIVDQVNALSIPAFDAPMRAEVKVRYSHSASPATLAPIEGGKIRVVFDTPQRAITLGQSAVFYDGDRVLGGGKIVG